MGGNIRRVIQMLSSSSEEVQRLATATLAQLGDHDYHDENRIGLVRAGSIPPLVRLLGSGSATVQQTAATALGKLPNRPSPVGSKASILLFISRSVIE